MASPKKRTDGSWRIQIEIAGVRDSKVLPTKRECENWAAIRTAELRNDAKTGLSGNHTLLAAFKKYANEVSTKNKGERWEIVRLKAFESQLPVSLPIQRITAQTLSEWRDARLRTVSKSTGSIIKPASVLREMKLLGSVFEVARREWRWIAENPLRDVRKPKDSEHRRRIITLLETRKLLRIMGYQKATPTTEAQALAVCMLFALSTGMRNGEVLGMTWANVKKGYVHLPDTKTDLSRNVPLSKVGIKLLERMRGYQPVSVFGLSASDRDSRFRAYRAKLGIKGLTWHDLRHSAATRLGKAGSLSVIELCKIFGWADPKQAMTYFNPTVQDLAAKL
jgi:integrase